MRMQFETPGKRLGHVGSFVHLERMKDKVRFTNAKYKEQDQGVQQHLREANIRSRWPVINRVNIILIECFVHIIRVKVPL